MSNRSKAIYKIDSRKNWSKITAWNLFIHDYFISGSPCDSHHLNIILQKKNKKT